MSPTGSAGSRQPLQRLVLPQTSLWYNLEVAAKRYPSEPAVIFYDSVSSYSQLELDARRLAGFLQVECGVKLSQPAKRHQRKSTAVENHQSRCSYQRKRRWRLIPGIVLRAGAVARRYDGGAGCAAAGAR